MTRGSQDGVSNFTHVKKMAHTNYMYTETFATKCTPRKANIRYKQASVIKSTEMIVSSTEVISNTPS